MRPNRARHIAKIRSRSHNTFVRVLRRIRWATAPDNKPETKYFSQYVTIDAAELSLFADVPQLMAVHSEHTHTHPNVRDPNCGHHQKTQHTRLGEQRNVLPPLRPQPPRRLSVIAVGTWKSRRDATCAFTRRIRLSRFISQYPLSAEFSIFFRAAVRRQSQLPSTFARLRYFRNNALALPAG